MTSLGDPFGLGTVISRSRFSEIVPVRWSLLTLFRALRYIFGETGAVSEWTRSWPCSWRMTVLSTGHTEYGNDRLALIEREHAIFAEMQLPIENQKP